MPPTSKVRLKESGLVVNERVTAKDQVLVVPAEVAERMLSDGRAAPADVRMRVLKTGLIGETFRVPGDVIEVSESDARGLHRRGRADFVDHSELRGTEPLAHVDPTIAPLTRTKPPYHGEAHVKVKVLRDFLAGDRCCTPGEVVEIPETAAVHGLAAGACEMSSLSALSWVARLLLSKLTPESSANEPAWTAAP